VKRNKGVKGGRDERERDSSGTNRRNEERRKKKER
jgi:hypothetical protein